MLRTKEWKEKNNTLSKSGNSAPLRRLLSGEILSAAVVLSAAVGMGSVVILFHSAFLLISAGLSFLLLYQAKMQEEQPVQRKQGQKKTKLRQGQEKTKLRQGQEKAKLRQGQQKEIQGVWSGEILLSLLACVLQLFGGLILVGTGILYLHMVPEKLITAADKSRGLVPVYLSAAVVQAVLAGLFLTKSRKEERWKKNSARVLNGGILAVILNQCVLLALTLAEVENRQDQMGLTGIVLGAGVILMNGLYVWRVLMEQERFSGVYHHFRRNQAVIVTNLSLRKDFAVVAGKIILGIVTMSGFMFANALYSLCMGFARLNVIRSWKKGRAQLLRSYRETGMAIAAASVCYVIYAVRLFGNATSSQYGMIPALAIAAYTFTEVFLVIKDFIKARKRKDLFSEQIKLISLSSILVCVVLTQTAVMSIASEGDHSIADGLAGIVFGSLSGLTGCYMMIRYRWLEKSF